MINDRANNIRAMKAAKTGSVMTAAEFQELAKGKKFGANPMEGKFHSGGYETVKGSMYFRSKWEANIALYLDWLVKMGKKKDWEYETMTFQFDGIKTGTRFYRIDFKVIDLDDTFEIWEVKGFLTPKAKTALTRMKKYHPLVKIVLIERKQYDAILKSMKGIIKFY